MDSKFNPFVHIEIYVSDMKRAAQFYETVLGVEMRPMDNPDEEEEAEMMSFPWYEGAPNISGTLVRMNGMGPGANGTVVYFACEDCGNELGRVEGAGGKLLREKFSIGEHGFCGLASDTEGNTIGFHSMK